MLNDEILKRMAAETMDAMTRMQKAQKSKEIEAQTQEFLANGGIIKPIKIGVSSDFPNGELPIKTQKDYRAVHARMQKASLTENRKVVKVTRSKVNG